MSTISWFSRLVLGSKTADAVEAAEEKYQRTLNGHKFEPEAMRAKLRLMMRDVERKAAALSIPPPKPNGEATDERSGYEPAHRREEVGVG
jgi:hypothetical protein